MAISTKFNGDPALPPLGAAVICEKVLMERDNVPSAIRIVDTVRLPEAGMPTLGTITDLGLYLLVIFKKGEADGEMKMRVRQIGPSGKRAALGEATPISFTGPPEGGANVCAPVTLKWDKEGLYWFDILLDNIIVARVPLKVLVVKTDASADAPGA